MSEKEKLINYIISWTPEQLERFLNHEITQEILQGEKGCKYYPPKDPPTA